MLPFFPQPFVVIRLWETEVAKFYVRDEKILKLVLGLQRAPQGLNAISICLLLGNHLKFTTYILKTNKKELFSSEKLKC